MSATNAYGITRWPKPKPQVVVIQPDGKGGIIITPIKERGAS